MNSRTRKTQFMRYKRKMTAKGYCFPKWKLENRRSPYKWTNLSPSLFEEAWMIDMGFA